MLLRVSVLKLGIKVGDWIFIYIQHEIFFLILVTPLHWFVVVSWLHFCLSVLADLFVTFFFFLKFLLCFSLVLFYEPFLSFLPALDTVCLVLFHFIAPVTALLPSLLEGKGMGLIFPLKKSSWALAKPLETKWWGRLQWEYPWWMGSRVGLPLQIFLTHKHQAQEAKKILERINYGKPLQ